MERRDRNRRRLARAVAGVVTTAAIGGCTPADSAAHDADPIHPSAEGAMQILETQARAVVNGVELHYVERGSGVPVVLVHGSLVDYGYWQDSNQIEPLSQRFRVIAYSRRYNHPNRNAWTGDHHSALVEARDLAAFIDERGLEAVHLVGHSYGAYTALLYALEHPERVRSLVLGEPPLISWLPEIAGGEGIFESFMAEIWEPIGRGFTQGGREAGLDLTSHWYFQLPFSELEPDWQTPLTNNALEWHALAVSADAFPKIDFERVRSLRVPTLLLSGGKNELGFNDLIDRELQRLLPNAERLVIPDSSHEMFLDLPEVTAQAMLGHFARH
jgi:non-heme chloroperoxidase